MDVNEELNLEHFLFGYYKLKGLHIRNLLVVGCSPEFEEKVYLVRGALKL